LMLSKESYYCPCMTLSHYCNSNNLSCPMSWFQIIFLLVHVLKLHNRLHLYNL
jgi:hypothetical protein